MKHTAALLLLAALPLHASDPIIARSGDHDITASQIQPSLSGLSEDEREVIYARLDSRHYPRAQGEGIRAAAHEIAEAVSHRVLGIA